MKSTRDAYEIAPRQALNRHWLWIFLWTALGVVLGSRTEAAGLWLAAAAALAGVCILYAPVILARRAHGGTALLCLALGVVVYVLRSPCADQDELHLQALRYPRQPMVFEGTAADAPVYFKGSNYISFVLHVDTLAAGEERIPVRGAALVRWTRATGPVCSGERLRVRGRLSPVLGRVNHGLRGVEDHYRRQGVFSQLQATGDAVARLDSPRFSPRYWASRLRQWQGEEFASVAPPSAYPFVMGVWLGERGLIAQDEYQRFVQAGTAHVLAVSGIHVALLSLSLGFLLRTMRLPRRVQIVLLLLAVFMFALMTGARASTMRAAIMIALYFAAELARREPDGLSTLGLSGFLFLLWRPGTMFDPGFLLSYGSVGSLMLFYPGFERRLRFLPRLLRASLAASLAVQLGTIPLAAWHFNVLPLVGVAANLIVVPLLSVVLWLCLTTCAVLAAAPPLALITGHALLPATAAIQWTNEWAAHVPGAFLHVLRPGILGMLFYGLGALYLYAFFYNERSRRRSALIAGAMFAASIAFWNISFRPPGVDLIDVGTGDASFIRTPGGTTLLVDGGDCTETSDAGERTVAPFLYANGVKRLDFVVVTHSDRDHIGGLFHIIKQFPVRRVVMGPELNSPSALETAFLHLCAERGIPVARLQAGDVLDAKGATICALHPDSVWAQQASENNRSLVLHVLWPGFSCLLTGDIEEESEKRILQRVKPRADVLKIPHHGSPTSNSIEFLKQVSPAMAAASLAPPGSRASLMTDAMVDRYGALNIPLLRTDWHGGIRLRRVNGAIKATTARGARGYAVSPIP